MIFVPLPRLVFPTHAPLFWLRRTWRLCSTPKGLSARALGDLLRGLRVLCPGALPRSTSESGGGRSGREGSVRVDPSRVLRCVRSTGWRSGRRVDLAKACLADLLFEAEPE